MLFVTLHGGKPGKHLNNVNAYDKEGQLVTASLLEESPGVVLDELRGIHMVGDFLYVANANRTQNSLLCYQGSGTSYRFIGTFASRETCAGILHPFDFTFDGAKHCYVSSQDTNVVTRSSRHLCRLRCRQSLWRRNYRRSRSRRPTIRCGEERKAFRSRSRLGARRTLCCGPAR